MLTAMLTAMLPFPPSSFPRCRRRRPQQPSSSAAPADSQVAVASPAQGSTPAKAAGVTTASGGSGSGGGGAPPAPPSELAELVGALGIPFQTGEVEQVVAALSNLGLDTVKALQQPMAADILTYEDLKEELQKGGMGRRAKGLAMLIQSKLAKQFRWSASGN